MTDACRTTQHCAVHGFCHRCNPDMSDRARRILRVLRDELNEAQTTAVYQATAAALADPPVDVEHCTHSRAMHDRHHQQPVDGCPWCKGGTTHHKPGDLL